MKKMFTFQANLMKKSRSIYYRWWWNVYRSVSKSSTDWIEATTRGNETAIAVCVCVCVGGKFDNIEAFWGTRYICTVVVIA